ncbi:MAG: pentapeptide repeat-containing protein [Proteobacteria bacterium]|nr:pentapeptide repeat-containing protein [Pseudomonadota bacterium]
MMIRKHSIFFVLLLLLIMPTSWAQERAIRPVETNVRQALVIGNSKYTHTGPLRNPANDAEAISSTLKQLGFNVMTLTDADQRQMDQAIRKFGADLRGSNGVGLFYFAGHGMQIEGENYLLPTDINPSNEFDVTYDAVPVGKLLGQMEAAGNGMNVVILDACRNNPFARSFRSSSRGLAQVIAPTGSFISYATAPGDVAADGEGDNGLFTEKLLQHMITPGLRLEEVFKRVRADVQQDSSNKQVPWDSSSVTGDFFFVPAEGVTTTVNTESASNQDFAAQAWDVIKDSEDPAILEEFIKMFPDTPQRNLAKLKLMTLKLSPSPDVLPDNSLSGEAAKKQLLETKECVGCDLTGAYLWKAELGESNLRGVDLRGAYLRGANLVGTNFNNAKLNGADLKETNLQKAIFCNTTMPDGSINNNDCKKASQASPEVGVVLSGETAKKRLLDTKECAHCNLDKVDLREADLRGVDLRNVSLTKAYLWKANLEGANLEGANLKYTNLELANLEGTNLKNTSLENARLVETKLTRANLLNANISNIQTFKTEFCETIMPDGSIKNSYCPKGSYQSYTEPDPNVVLSGEEAKKKILKTKECVGCDLQEVVLRGVNLTEATLTGVILYNSDLRYSNFGKANLSNADLRKANLWSADLRRANLRGVDLSEAILMSADLRHADLRGANLTDANKHNAYLTGAKFCNTTMPDGSINNDGC